MPLRLRSPFTTIRTEGALLPTDLLQRVLAGDADLKGLTPESYHLSGEKLNEAINRSWNRLQGAWAAFREAAARLPEADPATTVTRERWLLPVCQELGYGRLLAAKALEIDGKSYPISHGWESVPLHLVGAGTKLDERTPGVAGAARSSPHSLVQELLNRDASRLWGFVSNGLRWRVLRDNASLTRQAFVEFDLEAMFAGEVYADFAVFWLVCHQSRVEAEKPENCWLEQWSHTAQERGTRALETLRVGVETAISALGSGFLAHPANAALRDKLRAGNLDKQDYYRQLLRLVYRLIFLFVAEDRELLLMPGADSDARIRYTQYYSTTRLRHLAERLRGSRHADLYVALRLVIARLGQGGSPELGLPELGSFLFSAEAVRDLVGCELANADLLAAVRALAFTVEGRVRRAVDYKNLGPEELGSVYESLLELHPELNADAGTFALHTASGNERKTTGSHYTPSSLINCLLDSALDPVIEQALAGKKTPEEAARALLALKVCDPACGSGHFLIGAAYRLAKRLAGIRTGETEPSPEALRAALREVIGHCLYGVDINPMAVELCKVNLWLESLEPGKPLTFLDHHIQCGNSLIGATPALLARGIPDEAFIPIEGDTKKYSAEFKKLNKREQTGQLSFALDAERPAWERLGNLAAGIAHLEAAPDDTPEAVRAKQTEYEVLVKSAGYEFGHLWADAWCAAFAWKKTREFAYPITESVFLDIERNPFNVTPWMRDEIRRLAAQFSFFHWHLAFPDVFRPVKMKDEERKAQSDVDRNATGWEGGFHCVLGNPPWERIKLQEDEFFAARDPVIAQAANKAVRQRLIEALPVTDPALAQAFAVAKREAEAASHFVRQSGRYPLTAVGDVNTYALFAELARTMLAENGRAGIIVPTGIATDDTTKEFFGDLSAKQALASLFDFENREGLFPAVDSRMKFCLLTMAGAPVKQGEFVFFATRTEHLSDSLRRFTLAPDDIALFNPNTRTVPVFRTRADAELTHKIYQRVPVLVNEGTGANPWGMSFLRMFDMSNDSGQFVTGPRPDYVPLYEAKLIHQFDHRWATYAGDETRDLSVGEKTNPDFRITPRYWVEHWRVVRQLSTAPKVLIDAVNAHSDALISKVLATWLAGYHLNRGNEAIGNTVLARITPIFKSQHEAVGDWLTAKGFEQNFPMTDGDLATIQEHDEYIGMATALIERRSPKWLLGFRDIARATDERTAIFSLLPAVGVGHTLPLVVTESISTSMQAVMLANLNCLPFDYVVRQKIGGTHLTYGYIRQLPVLLPSAYTHEDVTFVCVRVCELAYTAWDTKAFADDMWREADQPARALFQNQWDDNSALTGGHAWDPPAWAEIARDGCPLPPFKWDESRRAVLRAELDAYFARLYGLTRDELRYILDPKDVYGPDFPGETFRVLKEKDERLYGEYRTQRLVLEAWDKWETIA